jgi:hypothetical protein
MTRLSHFVGHDDDVILIGSLGLSPFGVSTPVIKGDPFDPQHLADGTLGTEDLTRGRPPDHADFVRTPHILRRETSAVAQRPFPDLEIFRDSP